MGRQPAGLPYSVPVFAVLSLPHNCRSLRPPRGRCPGGAPAAPCSLRGEEERPGRRRAVGDPVRRGRDLPTAGALVLALILTRTVPGRRRSPDGRPARPSIADSTTRSVNRANNPPSPTRCRPPLGPGLIGQLSQAAVCSSTAPNASTTAPSTPTRSLISVRSVVPTSQELHR